MMMMASWIGTERKGSSLKELDVGDLYDQLETSVTYLKKLADTFGKTARRRFSNARDIAADTASDAEEMMKNNLSASLVLALGLGVIIGYMIRRGSE
jgi:hypothetical protein